MADQVQQAGWTSLGWMTFTIANGDVLHLGGASTTPPTGQLSLGNFLAAGIPQNATKTRFAEALLAEAGGHTIKHVVIRIISAGATSPAGRRASDGSTPTTSLGSAMLAPDDHTIVNNPNAIFNFKLFNRSGGNMVVDVEPFS